ncbi:hypothetical protein BDQ17DRAFT_1392181 [Cyathus striatus]|nr:hypothetical protein BDQ17DRAFT_1392181 [Cyathus striatus]
MCYISTTDPPDLKNKLLEYATCGLQVKEKKSTLHALEHKFDIPTVQCPWKNMQQIKAAVVEEIEKDLLQNNRPAFVKAKLKDHLIMVSHDKVHEIMLEYAPDGFDHCFSGKRSGKIISADGHDKLNTQALQMGDISLGIYGYRDKWSDTLLKLTLLPNLRSAAALGHIFLDLVCEIEGIGVQLTTDKGSEIGWQYAFQVAFHDIYSPEIDSNIFPGVISMKSVHNIVIESFWHRLKDKLGVNLRDLILQGKDQYIFKSHSVLHCDLFYWVFIPIIQEELDNFRTYCNQVLSQQAKLMPSGHVPIDALEHPEEFGGLKCLILVPEEAQEEARHALEEEVGPQDQHLCWYSHDFAQMANIAYQKIGGPEITFHSAWTVFELMSKEMEG